MSAEPLPQLEPEPDEPSIFDEEDEAHEARMLQEAEADIAAGRIVPHSEVSNWLETWGTPDYQPPPPRWFK